MSSLFSIWSPSSITSSLKTKQDEKYDQSNPKQADKLSSLKYTTLNQITISCHSNSLVAATILRSKNPKKIPNTKIDNLTTKTNPQQSSRQNWKTPQKPNLKPMQHTKKATRGWDKLISPAKNSAQVDN